MSHGGDRRFFADGLGCGKNCFSALFTWWRRATSTSNSGKMPPLTKCMVALRQLAYGTTTDMFDEHLHVGDTTGRECLAKFCESVVDAFDTTYLCKPNVEDCQFLMRMHNWVHGFPGMLGSIDCMHWEWKNCPAAWKGQFTNGYRGTHPTMILEAILDHRIWIWHAHFGMAGSNNDINVLNTSSLFTEQCNGNGLLIEFTTNGRQHHMGYYLADDMYPRWPVFLKTISCPTDPRSRGKATLGLGGPKGPPAIEVFSIIYIYIFRGNNNMTR